MSGGEQNSPIWRTRSEPSRQNRVELSRQCTLGKTTDYPLEQVKSGFKIVRAMLLCLVAFQLFSKSCCWVLNRQHARNPEHDGTFWPGYRLCSCGNRTGGFVSPPLEMLKGTLDLMVLQTFEAMGARHGDGIARRIEQIGGDPILLNQGTI